MKNNLKQINDDMLDSLLHYSQYLYEEENDRRDRLNNAVKVYIGILTFVLGMVAFKVGSLDQWSLFRNRDLSVVPIATFVAFGSSALAFLASFVYTILVLRMWPYKRLRDPVAMVVESVFIDSNEAYISSVISDYAVACDMNYAINNVKSKLLSRALVFLIVGLILFATSVVVDSMVCYKEALNGRMAEKTTHKESGAKQSSGSFASERTDSDSGPRKDGSSKRKGCQAKKNR